MNKIDNILPLPNLNTELAVKILTEIIYDAVHKTGLKKVVLGLSGGIDSALSYVLAVKALGNNNVIPVIMPYQTSAISSLEHAQLISKKFQTTPIIQDISKMANAYFNDEIDISNIRKGNIMARLRMIILYDLSSKHNALVLGTSNKTEILLGYTTLWGDMASAINPIGDLYKNQIRLLSSYIEVPTEIIEKPPSADLWEGQSDEEEMQMSYDIIDRILYHAIDLKVSCNTIKNKLKEVNIDSSIVDTILLKIQKNQFKRKMPLIAKVSECTINREFRYPRDWNM